MLGELVKTFLPLKNKKKITRSPQAPHHGA